MSGNLSFTGSAPTIQSNNPINIQTPNLTLNGQPIGGNEFKLVLDKRVFTATKDRDQGNFHIPGLSQYNDFLFVLKTTDEWNPRGTKQTIFLSVFSSGYSDDVYAMRLQNIPVYKHRTFVSRCTVYFNQDPPDGNLVQIVDFKDNLRDGDTFPSVRFKGTTYNNYNVKDYLYWYADELNQTVTFNVWLYARKI